MVELDSGGMGDGQEPAREVNQIMGICLLNSLKTGDVGTKAPNDFALLGVLGFEPVNVLGLGSELDAEGILASLAAGQISS